MNHTFMFLLVPPRPDRWDGEGSVDLVREAWLKLRLRALSWLGSSELQDPCL